MAATLMDGKALAATVRAEVAEEIRELGELGLATVLVGEDPASEVYIRHKHAACQEVGIRALDHRLPADAPHEDVVGLVHSLNRDDGVDGVLVQTPLPAQLDEPAILASVAPVKDVDGFHPFNVGQLSIGTPTHVPATPLGIMRLLREYEIPLRGARAVVVGRSTIVGKPVAMLLLAEHATVTICHSRTEDLAHHTRDADVLVAAVGVPHMIEPGMVKPGATVIDVGITRTDAGLVGDVDPAAAGVAGHVTPVPGGVGPMTVALLLANTVKAARYRRGDLAFPLG
jgi:methylenetetrahydrofolate dehydrogenase (NADP+) / methenyltetrahydrofolate cyclohydrolase